MFGLHVLHQNFPSLEEKLCFDATCTHEKLHLSPYLRANFISLEHGFPRPPSLGSRESPNQVKNGRSMDVLLCIHGKFGNSFLDKK